MLFFLTDYRGYTIRKNRWSPELEARAKIILNIAKSRSEAQKMLQKDGFKPDEITRILQRNYV